MSSYAVACLNVDSLLPYTNGLLPAYIIDCLYAYSLRLRLCLWPALPQR
jgi:hypothetical protein